MNGQFYYEPNPTSEAELKLMPPIPFSEKTWTKYRTGAVEVGVFQMTPLDVRQVLEYAYSILQPDREEYGIFEPRWQRKWQLTPTEYYPRVLRLLEQAQPVAGRFDWNLFAPVYNARRLVIGALELERGEARCKVCQRDFKSADLRVFHWSYMGGFKGSEYVCPSDHVLLRTEEHMLGEYGSPYRRTQRERIPGKCLR